MCIYTCITDTNTVGYIIKHLKKKKKEDLNSNLGPRGWVSYQRTPSQLEKKIKNNLNKFNIIKDYSKTDPRKQMVRYIIYRKRPIEINVDSHWSSAFSYDS